MHNGLPGRVRPSSLVHLGQQQLLEALQPVGYSAITTLSMFVKTCSFRDDSSMAVRTVRF